jgi:putative FmdB family regulatory protein
MPLYEYKCSSCSRTFERLERVSAPTTRECPSCGGESRRQLSAPALQFKGTGWYVTDYAKSGSGNGSGKNEATSANGTGTTSESTAETKSEPSSGGSKEGASSGDSSTHAAA